MDAIGSKITWWILDGILAVLLLVLSLYAAMLTGRIAQNENDIKLIRDIVIQNQANVNSINERMERIENKLDQAINYLRQ